MNARTIVALCVVVALVGGAGAWWVMRGDGSGTEEPAPGAESDSPTSPETATPEPEGEPVASCASEEPSSGTLPEPYWGMHVANPIGAEFPDAPIRTVNLTTSQAYWYQVETAPGGYDFTRLDAIVSTAEDRDAQPMLVMGFTPSFHAKRPESPTARATMPDEAAWRAWVTAAVERYGARLDYQVWPEPNIVGNWEGTAEQMARLSVIAAEIIHDRAPEALVVAPATAVRLPGQRRWMDRFWAAEVDGVRPGDVLDAVALDPFPLEDGVPEDSLDLICQAREILAKHAVDLPVWTNEINYGVPSGGGATDVQHYPDDRQAAAVARTYLLHAAIGVDRVYWLGWFSAPGMAVELARDGVTTPAGNAFTVVHDWLAAGPRPSCRVDEGVHTCVIEGQQVLRIHWRVRGTSTVAADDGATRIETLRGERRPVEGGDPIRVGQSPVAVFAEG